MTNKSKSPNEVSVYPVYLVNLCCIYFYFVSILYELQVNSLNFFAYCFLVFIVFIFCTSLSMQDKSYINIL